MKHGWEIKKLGEVCEIQGGSTPKRTESSFWENGTYPWFTIEDIREQGRIITDTKQKVTKIAWDKLRVFPEDTVLLCCTASLGEYAITKIPLTSNQQFNGLTIKDKTLLSPMYLMRYCAVLKEQLYALSGKATIDFVSADKVKQIAIPVPPIAEQERIVEELDCLSGVIEKKREQLKELDALAESIFYTMFGDPITNEKGWEVKKVIDVVKMQRGFDLPVQDRDTDGMIPIYGSNGIIGHHSTHRAEYGIITGRSGTLGEVYSSDKPFWPLNTTLFSVDTHGNNLVFLKFLISNFHLERFKAGAGVPTLNRNEFHGEDIPNIPLTLQQEFADKIEAIERQKELIKQSITETETLFNARMDYYFN